MRLIINPTNVKLNYTLRLYIGYKDLYTGIPINRFNRSLRYSIEETGIFSFIIWIHIIKYIILLI